MHEERDSEGGAAGTPPASGAPNAPPGGDFSLFLHKLRIQTFLTLGLLPNPVTGEKRCELAHAEALMADLEMLRRKTAGNLDRAEERLFEAVLDELSEQIERVRSRLGAS